MSGSTKVLQRSFAGGEISPEMFGRTDDTKYQTGLETCLNFLCRPQGPIENRPGFEFVREVKDSSKKVRLIPFVFNAQQTFVIELGHKYARFHSFGATLMNGNQPYEITTPWDADDLFELEYVQSNDIITVTHEDYAPTEIRRYSNTDWRLATISFSSTLATPTNVTAVRETTTGNEDKNADKYTFQYKVSCLNADKTIESEPSAAVSCTANLYATGTTIRISCAAVSGASYYRFYKNQGGIYGYIGDSETTSIIDDNIAPKTDITPRRYDSVVSSGNYPSAVGYFEQRRWFAGFKTDPQRVVATRSGTESDMTYSLPSKDDDRINFRIAATEFNKILHISPLSHLILLTTGSEIRISPQNSDAITPSSISARPQSYNGATTVRPLVYNNNLIFASARDGHVRELAYQYQAGGFVSGDLCLRSQHLFDFKTIKDATAQKAPYPIMWFVSSDGNLLGLTYIPEQQVGSWHRHNTDGVFESCCAVSEGVEDALYCVIRRTINGSQKRYVERMRTRNFKNLADAFFVDSGATYNGTPTTTISGIDWLEGKTVSILTDGAVQPQQKVVNGKVTLNHEASVVQVGLPYQSDVKTLPVILQDQSGGMGRVKNVYKITVRVNRSSGIFAGPSFDKNDLVEYKQRTIEPCGSPPALKSDEIDLQLYSTWTRGGQVCLRQLDPLPVTMLALTCDLSA